MVGTIRTNRVELLGEFVTPRGRELYSSLVGFNETGDSSLVSFKCKKEKVVVSGAYLAFHGPECRGPAWAPV